MHVSTAPGVSENEPGTHLWHFPSRRYLPAGHGRHWVFSDIAPMTPSVDVPVGHSLQLDWKTPPVVFANVFSSHCTHLLFIPFSKLPSGHGVQYESLYGCCPRGHVWHSVIPCASLSLAPSLLRPTNTHPVNPLDYPGFAPPPHLGGNVT